MMRLCDGHQRARSAGAGCVMSVFVCLFAGSAEVALCSRESHEQRGHGRAGRGCYGGASLAGECGTNMCGTNNCSVQYSPTFLPYKAVMDPSWLCKKKHDGEGKGREWKGREGKGREGEGREGKGREGKGREGKGREGKGREGKGAKTTFIDSVWGGEGWWVGEVGWWGCCAFGGGGCYCTVDCGSCADNALLFIFRTQNRGHRHWTLDTVH